MHGQLHCSEYNYKKKYKVPIHPGIEAHRKLCVLAIQKSLYFTTLYCKTTLDYKTA